MILASFGIILVIAWLIVRRVTISLSSLKSAVEQVTKDWNLTHRVPVIGNDEVSHSAHAVNSLLGNFQDVVSRIVTSARQTGASCHVVSASMSHVGEVVAYQCESTAAVAASVEQLSVSVTNLRDSASESLKNSRDSAILAEQGGQTIERASNEILRIGESVQAASQVIEQVGIQSNEISAIVMVIRDVADQTNVLALNAAIEAARAGELGRGFAVVADEVRKLAEKTAKSAQEIAAMIGSIQGSSLRAVNDIRAIVEQVSTSSADAKQALGAIIMIKDSARITENISQEIQAALREQSEASDLIAKKVEGIASASEENAVAAANAEESMRRLEEESQCLQSAVAQFST